MKRDGKKRLWILFDILLCAAIILAGLCLMAACLQIYYSGGEQIYTPEKVAAAFGRVAVPVYVSLGLILVSFILPLILKRPEGKAPRARDMAMERKRMLATRDPGQADPEKQTAIRQLSRGRLALRLICAGAWVLFLGVFVVFAVLNSAFYPDAADATAYVISLMHVFSPCVALCLGCGLLAARAQRRMDEKLIGLYKQCPPLPKGSAGRKKTWVAVVRYAVLGLAVAILVYGLVNGGWQDVLTKAINICTECVGLG